VGISQDVSTIAIRVNGTDVDRFASLSRGAMEEGDYLLFYVAESDATIEVVHSDTARLMEQVDVAPLENGSEIWYGSADEGGQIQIPTDTSIQRHMLIGFTKPPVLIFDVSIANQPKILSGYAFLKVEGELGLYFSYPTEQSGTCIAVDHKGIIDVDTLN